MMVILLTLGMGLLSMKNYIEAEKFLQRAVEFFPWIQLLMIIMQILYGC